MKILFAALVPLALAGCAEPVALPVAAPLIRAASPDLSAPAPSGPSVAYLAHPIAEPLDWRDLNDAQAPGAGS
ncbi:MAG: hypothetical protein ACX93U_17065 [Salipiger thiooxidans]|uniref:hypothetical protein n=1 Tax=Salipiger thiooxidans TaxID=282683 RepID=UPI001CFAAFCC|nr:hypothetical protein [Salipiger thiooxidans]